MAVIVYGGTTAPIRAAGAILAKQGGQVAVLVDSTLPDIDQARLVLELLTPGEYRQFLHDLHCRGLLSLSA